MPRRRTFLKALGALSLSALPRAAFSDHAADMAGAPAIDLCGIGGGQPLFVPGASGFLGRLTPDGAPLTLRAVAVGGVAGQSPLAYTVEHAGQSFVNPTLVLHPGERVRIALDNALAEPTITHWHGLANDTRNDGAGMPLVAPGESYAYDFEVRDRASLYWYHPHPHGLTGSQAYRGLFGLIEVEDDDERALRASLDLTPGKTEIPLILRDPRRTGDYAATDADRMHGFLGDTVAINGTLCPYLDVATRIYRFRILNASNARTYRLGLRTASGNAIPFVLIGGDGGLLATARRCDEAFVASAERIDILVDLSSAAVGDTVVLETRAFDPMHMEMGSAATTAAAPIDHAAMGHAMPPATGSTPPAGSEHAGHGGAFPEGAAASLMQLRVRERVSYGGKIPARLSSIAPIDIAGVSERPLRLGFAKGRWRINDRVFAMGETPIEVKRDTVEVWLIRNYFNSMPHAMHLHGFHFQVLERQTSPDQITGLRIDERNRLATDLGWKDTVLVWPGESVRVAIDFTMPFPGEQTYMFHCHNLEHEDGGMMLGVKVA